MASTGRARFTAHFTDAQKEAVIRAVAVEGHTVADVIRKARAGELGLPAFDIGRYAYQLVRDGRERYEADHDDALHAGIDRELKALEIAALAHARAVRARLKGDGTDSPDAIAKAAQGLSATRKARRDTQGAAGKPKAKQSAVQTDNTNGAAKPNGDPLSNLLGLATQQTRQGAKSGSVTRPPSEAPSSPAPLAG